jgi:hypothetical protein
MGVGMAELGASRLAVLKVTGLNPIERLKKCTFLSLSFLSREAGKLLK